MSALTLLRDTVSRLIAEIDRLDPGNIEAARASGVMSAVAAMDFAPIVEPSARKKAGRSTRIADERDHAMAASYRSGRTILEVAPSLRRAPAQSARHWTDATFARDRKAPCTTRSAPRAS
jgi:hypothetical protein